MSQRLTKQTKWHWRPAKTRISLIRVFAVRMKKAWVLSSSRKHAYILLTPLKPNFYIVKLGFTVVYIIFLILLENIDCGYSLEPPRRGGSNEYPQSMFWAKLWKISEFFYLKIFSFLEVKFSIYLNRRVFVMYPFSAHEDSDQTGRMPRMIWVFAGRTCHFVAFYMRWLI